MADDENKELIWGKKCGMDYSIFCIAKAMMEDFDPNAVLLDILTDVAGLYRTYAKYKVPDSEYKDIAHQLQFAIDAVKEAMAKQESD